MEMNELRSKSREELLQLISELKGKMLALRFESSTGQLTETHLIKSTKRDIARIFTVLKEKEKGIEVVSKKETKPESKKDPKPTKKEKDETKVEAPSQDPTPSPEPKKEEPKPEPAPVQAEKVEDSDSKGEA